MNKRKVLSDYLDKYRKKSKKKLEIKQSLKKLKLFNLNEKSLISILENRILPNYPYLKYDIRKAKTTDSYYIKLSYDNTYVYLRISNHESYTGAKGKVITNQTTKKEIESIIKDRIRDLQVKSKAWKFTKIEKGK